MEDLDTKRPNKVQLLGKNIVVWQAPDGSWSALEDLCPHRLAPLSGAAFPLIWARLAAWFQAAAWWRDPRLELHAYGRNPCCRV